MIDMLRGQKLALSRHAVARRRALDLSEVLRLALRDLLRFVAIIGMKILKIKECNNIGRYSIYI